MRKSKEESARTRERIITAAAEEFRERGIVATGLADLMKAAGLTHGGFYKHFASKDELVREVAERSMDATTKRIQDAADKRPGNKGIVDAVATYLSAEHRDSARNGCALPSIGAELARANADTRARATEGFLNLVQILSRQADNMRPDQAKKRAVAAVATMVGAMTMARMVNDTKLSDTILKSAADSVVGLFE